MARKIVGGYEVLHLGQPYLIDAWFAAEVLTSPDRSKMTVYECLVDHETEDTRMRFQGNVKSRNARVRNWLARHRNHPPATKIAGFVEDLGMEFPDEIRNIIGHQLDEHDRLFARASRIMLDGILSRRGPLGITEIETILESVEVGDLALDFDEDADAELHAEVLAHLVDRHNQFIGTNYQESIDSTDRTIVPLKYNIGAGDVHVDGPLGGSKPMPFGGYEDFDACVAANSDKRDPNAYCAAIQNKSENVEGVGGINIPGVINLNEHAFNPDPEDIPGLEFDPSDLNAIVFDAAVSVSRWVAANGGKLPTDQEIDTLVWGTVQKNLPGAIRNSPLHIGMVQRVTDLIDQGRLPSLNREGQSEHAEFPSTYAQDDLGGTVELEGNLAIAEKVSLDVRSFLSRLYSHHGADNPRLDPETIDRFIDQEIVGSLRVQGYSLTQAQSILPNIEEFVKMRVGSGVISINREYTLHHESPNSSWNYRIGVEVFRSGEVTDSKGHTRSWSNDDLDRMVGAFNAGIPESVAIKMGHSTEDFATKVSGALNLTSEVLLGEGTSGDGQASLGRIVGLRRSGDILLADFETPIAVSDIVDRGFFTHVSSEIYDQFKGHSPVLSAVALLGAERPAVKGLSRLGESDPEPDWFVESEFNHQEAIARVAGEGYVLDPKGMQKSGDFIFSVIQGAVQDQINSSRHPTALTNAWRRIAPRVLALFKTNSKDGSPYPLVVAAEGAFNPEFLDAHGLANPVISENGSAIVFNGFGILSYPGIRLFSMSTGSHGRAEPLPPVQELPVWAVPVTDTPNHRQVVVNVNAPNENAARSFVASFLERLAGTLGMAVGGAVSARFLIGKPTQKWGAAAGLAGGLGGEFFAEVRGPDKKAGRTRHFEEGSLPVEFWFNIDYEVPSGPNKGQTGRFTLVFGGDPDDERNLEDVLAGFVGRMSPSILGLSAEDQIDWLYDEWGDREISSRHSANWYKVENHRVNTLGTDVGRLGMPDISLNAESPGDIHDAVPLNLWNTLVQLVQNGTMIPEQAANEATRVLSAQGMSAQQVNKIVNGWLDTFFILANPGPVPPFRDLDISTNTEQHPPDSNRDLAEITLGMFSIGELTEPEFLTALTNLSGGDTDNPLFIEFWTKARNLGLFGPILNSESSLFGEDQLTTLTKFVDISAGRDFIVHLEDHSDPPIQDRLLVTAETVDEARMVAEDLIHKLDGEWGVTSVVEQFKEYQFVDLPWLKATIGGVFAAATLAGLFVLGNKSLSMKMLAGNLKPAIRSAQRAGVSSDDIGRELAEQAVKHDVGALDFSLLIRHLFKEKVSEFSPSHIDTDIGRIVSLGSKGGQDMDAIVLKELGLAPTATQVQVLEAITALKATPTVNMAEFKEAQEGIKVLKHKEMVHKYEESTRPLVAIEGTTEELAEILAITEEIHGEDEAKRLLNAWGKTQASAQKMGAFGAILSNSRPITEGSLEDAVKKFMESNPSYTQAEAYASIVKSNPNLYSDYKEEVGTAKVGPAT